MTRGHKPKYDPRKHNRQSTRLRGYDYTSPGAYFVTMVTYQRVHLFGAIAEGDMILNAAGRIADECWRAIPNHFHRVELGAYIVMPNHVHGIIVVHEPAVVGGQHAVPLRQSAINVKSGSLGAIVRSYKSAVTRRIRRANSDIYTVWQRNYHDRVIRNEREYRNITRYIENNPANWDADQENKR